jgi:hypothetical protein
MPFLYKLCDWIKKEKLCWSFLANNKYYIDLLLQIPPEMMWMISHRINWQSLSSNPNAIELLEKNQDYINWYTICYNRSAKFLINKNKNKIIDTNTEFHEYNISDESDEQSNTVFITKKELRNYKDKTETESSDDESIDPMLTPSSPSIIESTEDIDNTLVLLHYDNSSDDFEWMRISRNSKDINFLEQNLEKIHWYALSRNPNGIELLEKHIDKINWKELSKNPNGIELLEKHTDKIDWKELSKNPKAMHLLEKNQDKIDWSYISQNSSIFTLNYDFIKKHMSIIKEELIAKALHPTIIEKWINAGIDIEDI